MIPLPGRSARWVRSQPSRSRESGRARTPSRRESRPSGAADGQDAGAELFLDVVDHARVGRGSGGQDRDRLRQLGDQVRDPPVVGPEVVAPVGNAVGFINHQQAGPPDELRQLVFAEGRVGEPFRRNQQDVHFIGGELFPDGVPLQLVGRVDGHGTHSGAGGGGHLVPHQGEQRRDDQRGPGAAAPEQQGRHEVHRRFSPAGALDHQSPPAAVDQCLNGLKLAVMEVRLRMPHEFRGGPPVPRILVVGRRSQGKRKEAVAFWLSTIDSVSQPPPTPRSRSCLCGQSAADAASGARAVTHTEPTPPQQAPARFHVR